MLRDRLLLGISIGLLGLLPFILPGTAGAMIFILLSTVFMALLLAEMFELCRRFGLTAHAGWGTAFGAGWIALYGWMRHLGGEAATHARWLDALWRIAPALFLLLILRPTLREANRRKAVGRMFVSFAGLFFILNTIGMIPRIYFWSHLEPAVSGRILALYLILVTKMSDVGAYAVGMSTARRFGGNHKMIPALSPGKSWEGLLGGLAAGVVAALAFTWPRQALFGGGGWFNGWGQAVLFGLGCALAGLAGDLVASLLKRAAKVKDSGRIPGLGGLLDMFDSLIFVVPLFYGYLHFRYGG